MTHDTTFLSCLGFSFLTVIFPGKIWEGLAEKGEEKMRCIAMTK